MVRDPQLDILKKSELFRQIPPDELNELFKLGVTQQYEEYTNIVIEGELSWGIYFLIKGMAGVFKQNKLTHTEHDLGELRSGDFFGELSLIEEEPRAATVRSLTECTLYFISKELLFQFLNQSHERLENFYKNCIRVLTRRLRDLDEDYIISQYQLWEATSKRKE